jgi:hypothetical protein
MEVECERHLVIESEQPLICETVYRSTNGDQLAAFVGKHSIYTYDNGWQRALHQK